MSCARRWRCCSRNTQALLDGVIEASAGQLGSLRDEVLRLARMVDALWSTAAADAAGLQPDARRLATWPALRGGGGRQPDLPVRGGFAQCSTPRAGAGPGCRR